MQNAPSYLILLSHYLYSSKKKMQLLSHRDTQTMRRPPARLRLAWASPGSPGGRSCQARPRHFWRSRHLQCSKSGGEPFVSAAASSSLGRHPLTAPPYRAVRHVTAFAFVVLAPDGGSVDAARKPGVACGSPRASRVTLSRKTSAKSLRDARLEQRVLGEHDGQRISKRRTGFDEVA
jgi:hypothetical protein